MLDYTSLRKALASLVRAVDRSALAQTDDELRDSAIQRFGYTYELCWKMLKRRLEEDAATPAEIDKMSFRELLREGAARGLVADPSVWMHYRELRNLTAHTYDEAKADQVRQAIPAFQRDAAALLAAMAEGRGPD
jgi:nucleotidyltransferase substrate binding protein (TIGR01987 family)